MDVRFESPKGHYTAKACVVWCFDARFADLYDVFLKERGWQKQEVDVVTRAGGAKALAMDGDGDAGGGNFPVGKSDVRAQIRGSIDLHHTDRVILMVHIDCGGYGGSKTFHDDHQAEWNHHAAELAKAASFVRATFPEIKEIESWIAHFDGATKVA